MLSMGYDQFCSENIKIINQMGLDYNKCNDSTYFFRAGSNNTGECFIQLTNKKSIDFSNLNCYIKEYKFPKDNIENVIHLADDMNNNLRGK